MNTLLALCACVTFARFTIEIACRCSYECDECAIFNASLGDVHDSLCRRIMTLLYCLTELL